MHARKEETPKWKIDPSKNDPTDPPCVRFTNRFHEELKVYHLSSESYQACLKSKNIHLFSKYIPNQYISNDRNIINVGGLNKEQCWELLHGIDKVRSIAAIRPQICEYLQLTDTLLTYGSSDKNVLQENAQLRQSISDLKKQVKELQDEIDGMHKYHKTPSKTRFF